MFSVNRIADVLAANNPQSIDVTGMRHAAVALILQESEPARTDVLFIVRATHEDDPWSGQVAFPGGRVDPGDANMRQAAERETTEEVGLNLTTARYLGRLDDLRGRRSAKTLDLVIGCFVYALNDPAKLKINHEVDRTIWSPLSHLIDSGRYVDYYYDKAPEWIYPGVKLEAPGQPVLWGLTYRFMHNFLDLLGHELPGEKRAH